MIEIDRDVETIEEAGFNRYMMRTWYKGTSFTQRAVKAESLVGGTIGSEGLIYIGSKQFRIDGEKIEIVLNDGTKDRLLIGKEP